MEKKEDFLMAHAKEVGFVIFVSFFTLNLINGASKVTGDSLYSFAELIFLSLMFCGLAFLFGRSATTSKEADNLRLVTALCAAGVVCVLVGYSCYALNTVAVNDIIKVCTCGIVCALFCGGYFDTRIGQLRKSEEK